MKTDTKMNGGGGDFDVLRLCAVLGVCLMLCMPLVVSGFPIADEVFADTSSGVEGSGTADDPYR